VRRALFASSAFARSVKRLRKKNPAAFEAVRSKLPILQENAFDPRLGSHKLKGDLAGSVPVMPGTTSELFSRFQSATTRRLFCSFQSERTTKFISGP